MRSCLFLKECLVLAVVAYARGKEKAGKTHLESAIYTSI